MRLTFHTDYSLRLLMLLALEPGRLHTIEDVSRRYGVSRNHMMKVAQTLTQTGFVETVRGRGGGLRLARPAAAINVGAVVRATEEGFALVECFDGARNLCVITPECGLRVLLQDALRAFLTVLDGKSLADLVGRSAASKRMRALLGGTNATMEAGI